MSRSADSAPAMTRRSLLALGAAGLAATACSRSTAATEVPPAPAASSSVPSPSAAPEPFYGAHQSGILTAAQAHTYFAALDIDTKSRDEMIALLRRWTDAGARLSAGHTALPIGQDVSVPGNDSGECLGLPHTRLTITVGFGAGCFTKDGADRFGLAARRPAAFIDLPKFPGDQLVAERCGGDISLQACADDAQVAFHAVRQLVRLGEGVVRVRWVQSGFLGKGPEGQTPRNLLGFKDGTGNPDTRDAALMDRHVWVGAADGAPWMVGGTYQVARRIRMAIEHWDRTPVAFQEQTFGRAKYTGAPLGGAQEESPLDLDATTPQGDPVIPENAHVRLAHFTTNDGARILRRSYSYNDGANVVAERWPPWHQGMEYDAGLLFICYQRDVRTGFAKIFERMSRFDMLNQFVTTVGSACFACPPGPKPGGYIGEQLFA
jgi:deferrochelatase/peroxidase EfeB